MRSSCPAARSSSPAVRSSCPAARSSSPAGRSSCPAARSSSPAGRDGCSARRPRGGSGERRRTRQGERPGNQSAPSPTRGRHCTGRTSTLSPQRALRWRCNNRVSSNNRNSGGRERRWITGGTTKAFPSHRLRWISWMRWLRSRSGCCNNPATTVCRRTRNNRVHNSNLHNL